MRRIYLTLLILTALFTLGTVTSCIVRSHPSHGHHGHGVKRGHDKHKHKHAKGPKKHKH